MDSIETKKKIGADKVLFSIILSMSPILGIYASFIPGVSIGELALIIFAAIALIKNESPISLKGCHTSLLIFIWYTIIITIIAYMFNIYEFYWFNRLIRFIMYTFVIITTSKRLLDKKVFFKCCYYLSILICCSLVFQYAIFNMTGTYVKLYGGVLPLMDESRLAIDYDSILKYSFFRPSSFFTEPAHVSQLLIIPLTFFLFDNSFSTKRRIAAVLFSGVAILMSTSLWGIVLLFFDIALWYITQLMRTKKLKWLLAFPIIVIIMIMIYNSSFFQNSISRIDMSNVGESATFSGRFSGYENLADIGIVRLIFGSGFGNINNLKYSNSILYLLYGTGIVGIFIWVKLAFDIVFFKRKFWLKVLFGCFVLLLFGSSVILSLEYVIIFSIIFGAEDKSEEVNKYDYSK